MKNTIIQLERITEKAFSISFSIESNKGNIENFEIPFDITDILCSGEFKIGKLIIFEKILLNEIYNTLISDNLQIFELDLEDLIAKSVNTVKKKFPLDLKDNGQLRNLEIYLIAESDRNNTITYNHEFQSYQIQFNKLNK